MDRNGMSDVYFSDDLAMLVFKCYITFAFENTTSTYKYYVYVHVHVDI